MNLILWRLPKPKTRPRAISPATIHGARPQGITKWLRTRNGDGSDGPARGDDARSAL